jgi:hypothetical protein
MHKLAMIYEEAKYDLYGLLRSHKIFKDLGMNEQDIRNVLDLLKNNQLQTRDKYVREGKDGSYDLHIQTQEDDSRI